MANVKYTLPTTTMAPTTTTIDPTTVDGDIKKLSTEGGSNSEDNGHGSSDSKSSKLVIHVLVRFQSGLYYSFGVPNSYSHPP